MQLTGLTEYGSAALLIDRNTAARQKPERNEIAEAMAMAIAASDWRTANKVVDTILNYRQDHWIVWENSLLYKLNVEGSESAISVKFPTVVKRQHFLWCGDKESCGEKDAVTLSKQNPGSLKNNNLVQKLKTVIVLDFLNVLVNVLYVVE